MHPITSAQQERATKGIRKWAALHVRKPHREVLVIPGPAPQIPANHCQGDRSCAFPPMFQGRCRQHFRDLQAEGSLSGTCHGLLVADGFVESETQMRPAYRRCTPQSAT